MTEPKRCVWACTGPQLTARAAAQGASKRAEAPRRTTTRCGHERQSKTDICDQFGPRGIETSASAGPPRPRPSRAPSPRRFQARFKTPPRPRPPIRRRLCVDSRPKAPRDEPSANRLRDCWSCLHELRDSVTWVQGATSPRPIGFVTAGVVYTSSVAWAQGAARRALGPALAATAALQRTRSARPQRPP